MSLNIALYGVPGSGKGTQAKLMCDRFGLVHLSTGDVLRDEINAGTPLGRKAEALVKEGKFVSDEDVKGLVRGFVRSVAPEAGGVIFDGYPRNVAQLESLEGILADDGQRLDAGISLDLDEKAVVERLANRRTCEECGTVYNLATLPPKSPGRCDRCGGTLYQRSDDVAETISQRMEEYHRQTKPILARLEEQAKLARVEASRGIDEVQESLVGVIDSLERPERAS